MKRGILLAVIIVFCLFLTPVYAEDSRNSLVGAHEVRVCDVGCPYTSVDAVLDATEASTISKNLKIVVDTNKDQIIKNHTIAGRIDINVISNTSFIKGDVDTIITVLTGGELAITGSNVELRDLNIIYAGEYGDYTTGSLDDVLYFKCNNITMDNVNISSNKKGNCTDLPSAIFNESDKYSMKNVVVSNFSNAIYHMGDILDVDNCFLDNNSVSIVAKGDISINNSSIKNVFTTKGFNAKNINDLKVQDVSASSFNTPNGYCDFITQKGIFVLNNQNNSVSLEKELDINMADQRTVENIIELFKEGSAKGFSLYSSDNNVAYIDGGNVRIKNAGEAYIRVVNNDTNEEYTLNMNVSNKATNNPFTGHNYLFFYAVIILFLIGVTIYIYKVVNKEQ